MAKVTAAIIPTIYVGEPPQNGYDRKVMLTENGTAVPKLIDEDLNQTPTTTLGQITARTVANIVSKVDGEVYSLAALAAAFGETSTGNLYNKIVRQDGMWHNYTLLKAGQTPA